MNLFLAYVDPGVGLLVWQTIVAAILGLLFYLRKTRMFIVSLVLRATRRGKAPEPLGAKGQGQLDSPGQ